jgi:predicted flap endonuclease-1-like 5' DNA nuclease
LHAGIPLRFPRLFDGASTRPFPEVMVVWFAGQSLVFILLAFLLGIIVGRLTVRRDKSVSTTGPETATIVPATTEIVAPLTPTTPEVEQASSVKALPSAVRTKPRPRKASTTTTENPEPAGIGVASTAGQPVITDEPAAAAEPVTDDELERIEGIGTKMADALRATGIRTFAQLAASSDDIKRAAINAAGLTFAPSLTTWSRQARLLADGDEEAFTELTARLIARRDTEAVR